MNDEEQRPGSGSHRAIEDGETYEHGEHGTVEVTGIWHRTRRLDTAHAGDTEEMIVVRYVPSEGGEWIDERAESLHDFLDAIG